MRGLFVFLLHLMLILLWVQCENSIYRKIFIEDCALDDLCTQTISYTSIRNHETKIFVLIQNAPIVSICLSLQPVSENIYVTGNAKDFLHQLYCENVAITINNSYYFVTVPFSIPEGLYWITLFLSSRSQGTNMNHIYRVLHFVKALSDDSVHQIPFHFLPMYPPFGSIISKKMKLLFLPNYQFLSEYEGVLCTIEGVVNYLLPPQADIISTETEVEPGSWFITLIPFRNLTIMDSLMYHLEISGPSSEESLASFFISPSKFAQRFPSHTFPTLSSIHLGYTNIHYLEFVLSDQEILQQRLFSSSSMRIKDSRDLHLQLIYQKSLWKESLFQLFKDRHYMDAQQHYRTRDNLQSEESSASSSKSIESPIHVCITSGLSMDGQKRIWLQQTESLNPQKYSFYWILALSPEKTLEELAQEYQQGNITQNSVYYYLQQLLHQSRTNLFLQTSLYNAYTIQREELEEIPDIQTISAADYWQQNRTRLYEYLHLRYEAARGDLDAITPRWCRHFYGLMKQMLIENQCHLIVYGNSRAFTTDIFITDVARSLGIPSVTELLNLYLDERIIPDVIIAPSEHSLRHNSIQLPVIKHLQMNHYQYPPLQVVIQPAVDFQKFHSSSRSYNQPINIPPKRRAKSCHLSNHYHFPYSIHPQQDVFSKHYPCVLIGFVARLSTEKNPGLFIQMAYHLLQKYPFVRFRMIGNGLLKSQLELLAKRLNIDYAIDFIGWIASQDLPDYLDDLDIVVNPSLRGWSETFCISNLEVMSMGIPLVTFAVGGIGEYVSEPLSAFYFINNTGDSLGMIEETDLSVRDIPPFEIVNNAVIMNSANPRLMSEAILYLLMNPQQGRQIGENGRKSITTYFTIDRQMQQYDYLYESIYEVFWKSRKRNNE